MALTIGDINIEFTNVPSRRRFAQQNPIERMVNEAKQADDWFNQPMPDEFKEPPQGV